MPKIILSRFVHALRYFDRGKNNEYLMSLEDFFVCVEKYNQPPAPFTVTLAHCLIFHADDDDAQAVRSLNYFSRESMKKWSRFCQSGYLERALKKYASQIQTKILHILSFTSKNH